MLLVEIMVALAILSLICLTLTTTGGSAVDNASYLKEKTLAQWVATNKAAEVELAGKWVPVATSDGEYEMAGTTWYWSITGHETPDEDMRKAVIEVRRNEGAEGSLATLTVFFGRPVEP